MKNFTFNFENLSGQKYLNFLFKKKIKYNLNRTENKSNICESKLK